MGPITLLPSVGVVPVGVVVASISPAVVVVLGGCVVPDVGVVVVVVGALVVTGSEKRIQAGNGC